MTDSLLRDAAVRLPAAHALRQEDHYRGTSQPPLRCGPAGLSQGRTVTCTPHIYQAAAPPRQRAPDLQMLGNWAVYRDDWRAAHADVPVGDLALRTRCNQLVSRRHAPNTVPPCPASRASPAVATWQPRGAGRIPCDGFAFTGPPNVWPDRSTLFTLEGRHGAPIGPRTEHHTRPRPHNPN